MQEVGGPEWENIPLSAEDKKAMIAEGLDPADPKQIASYWKERHAGSGPDIPSLNESGVPMSPFERARKEKEVPPAASIPKLPRGPQVASPYKTAIGDGLDNNGD